MIRGWRQLVLHMLYVVCTASAVGFICRDSWTVQNSPLIFFAHCFALGLLAPIFAIDVLQGDGHFALIKAELIAGGNVFAFGLAHIISEFIRGLLLSLAYVIVYMHLVAPAAGWTPSYGTLFGVFFFNSAVGTILAVLLPKPSALHWALGLSVGFGGYFGAAYAVVPDLPSWQYVFGFLSYARWGVAALYDAEVQSLISFMDYPADPGGNGDLNAIYSTVNVSQGNYNDALIFLYVGGLVLRILTTLALFAQTAVFGRTPARHPEQGWDSESLVKYCWPSARLWSSADAIVVPSGPAMYPNTPRPPAVH